MVILHPALILGLQLCRDKLGESYSNVTINVNSGYRSVTHNRSEGGAVQSTHIFGMGADIVCMSNGKVIPNEVVADVLRKLDFGGIKIYNTFVHADVWTSRIF